MVGRGGGRSISRGLHRVGTVRAEFDTRGRLVVIGVLVIALFAGLLTRLWFLQVAGGESLAVAAQANSDEIVQVPALRGRILDDKGRVLAETKAVTALVVDRQKLTPDDRAKLVPNLAHALGITPEEVNKRLDSVSNQPFEAVNVAEPLSDDQAQYVLEHQEDFPATRTTSSFARVYPQGSLAAHVLGYTGQIDARGVPGEQVQGLPDGRHDREERHRADLRKRSPREPGAGEGAARQPRDQDRRVGRPEGGAGRRRATLDRHRRAGGGRGLARTGHRRRAPLDRPRQRELLQGHGRCGRGARRPYRCGGGNGVGSDVRPERDRHRWAPTRVSRPERAAPAHRSGAQPVRAGIHVQALLGDGDPQVRNPHRRRDVLRHRLFRLRQRPAALQRTQGEVRDRRSPAGIDRFQRRLLLQRRKRVLERLPRRRWRQHDRPRPRERDPGGRASVRFRVAHRHQPRWRRTGTHSGPRVPSGGQQECRRPDRSHLASWRQREPRGGSG